MRLWFSIKKKDFEEFYDFFMEKWFSVKHSNWSVDDEYNKDEENDLVRTTIVWYVWQDWYIWYPYIEGNEDLVNKKFIELWYKID